MKGHRWLGIALIVALLVNMIAVLPASANPPSPDGPTAAQANDQVPSKRYVKPIDQPNIKDYLRNRERMRLLESGRTAAADQLALTADDRILVILVEYAGTDTFTWNPGDTWDPLGIADPNEAVYDDDGNVIVGDCSNIISQTTTFTYTGPAHNEIPRPLSADDRSGDSIWTEDFSQGWFEAFMWGDGVVFNYTREDGSQVYEDFTGMSVKDYFLDMSGGDYEISGDVVGWLQLPHSTWYYGADPCPGARSGGSGNAGAIPGAGNSRQLVRDALDAVNAANPNFDWSLYDQDDDGLIDRLWIVHSGYGQEDATVLLNRTDYGEAAIWSHSSSVSPPYPVSPDVSAGPYIVMPENGGIGVFAHEYAHNLGAMDLYAYDQGETSTGFWALQADDWTGYPIGYQPPAVDPMHLDWWGWLDPYTVNDPEQEYVVTLGQASEFPGGDDVYRGVKIELPDGEAPLALPVWQGEYYWWGGKQDVANASMTTVAPIAIPAGGAMFSFEMAYDIEPLWDFLWVQASVDGQTWDTLTNANTVCEHDSAWIGGLYGFPDDLCAAGIGGFTGENAGWPDADTEQFDLAAYAGQSIYLRLWYMTDWATTNSGPFADNVMVTADGSVLFADDAETGDANWTYAAPWQRSSGLQTFSQNFYLQWRNVGETGGYDSALGDPRWRFGPANTGLLVWYNNDFYSDNEIWHYLPDYPSFGPKGKMLVLDSHNEPYRDPDYVGSYPNEAGNTSSRGQMRDAPFSLWDSIPFAHKDPYRPGANWHDYPGRPAVPAFHDSMGYYPGSEFAVGGPVGQTTPRWMTKQWDASTVVPATTEYAVKAPGYNGTDRFRFNCSLNDLGQVLCYGYPSGLGYPGGTGNPGDNMAQYGWHVEILDQTDSTATIRIWNSMLEAEGEVTQTSSTTPTVRGTYVDVDVTATNIGGAMEDGMFLVPVDPDAMYVAGSAYGGATPLTAGYAAQLAQQRGLENLADLAAAAKSPEDVVAVAWMGPVATGEMLEFGFTVKVTAMDGVLQHDVAVFDGATFVNAIPGTPMAIVDNSAYPVNRSRRFNVDRDSYIDGTRPSSFFGSDQTMWVGFFDQLRPVVHTPIENIPTDAFVDTAYLYLYIYEGRGFTTWSNSVINVDAHAATTEWMPVAVNWWMPWTAYGGDFGPAVGTNHVGSGKIGTWLRLDVTAAVEDMLRGGFNQGFVLTSDDSRGVSYGLATKENWTGNVGYIRVYFRTAQ